MTESSAVTALRSLSPQALSARRAEVRVLVLTGLGLNCEVETAEAFRLTGASPELVPLLDLLDDPSRLSAFHILVFPGGFAFGDHLGAGFVFANRIRWRIYDELVHFVDRGGLALGICNGFQTMVRLGILPGFDGDYRTPRATLAPNDRLGYWDCWVRLAVDPSSPCVWTRGLTGLELPSRHGEGKFLAADETVAQRLAAGRQIPLRYADAEDRPTQSWPDNPNGSADAIAGICDPSGRVFGLMPHPDAYLYPFQHPQWSRRRYTGGVAKEGGGLAIFRNGVDTAVATL
ncbi:MAG: phosphoribosylformylglycinamidine synthase subunit PurQ [Acidobacteriota bacterium]|nr:phosphoribosylformylglycinamidine synthase subunit PurQ [Acidobacteriota bacterium]